MAGAGQMSGSMRMSTCGVMGSVLPIPQYTLEEANHRWQH